MSLAKDGQSQAHMDVLVAFLREPWRTLHLRTATDQKKQKKREPEGSRFKSKPVKPNQLPDND
tara:strand:- start:8 stop:196 length:189 start_codon:yes stop_codon:yes gene_type:complete